MNYIVLNRKTVNACKACVKFIMTPDFIHTKFEIHGNYMMRLK